MRKTFTILIALTASITASPSSAQSPKWTTLDTPTWSAAGMIDSTDQMRRDGVITAWLRFVDAPGRPPAEDDPEVVDAMRGGSHVDLRASLDCRTRRFRVEGTRIVDRDERILDVGHVPAGEAFWVPLGRRTRASAAYAALCKPKHASR